MNRFEGAAVPSAGTAALRRLPGWFVFLLIAALYTSVMLGMDYLTGENIEPLSIAVTAASGIALSAVIFWLVRWQRTRERRKPDGWPTATNFRAAVSSGQLPEGARPEQWVPELKKAIRMEWPMAWIGMTLFIGFAGLGVFLIIDNPDYPWFWALATVVFTVLAVWYPIWAPRRRRKMQELIDQFPVEDA